MPKVQDKIIQILAEHNNRLSRQAIVKNLEQQGIINVSAYRAIKNLIEKGVLSVDLNNDEIIYPKGLENEKQNIGAILKDTYNQTQNNDAKLTNGEKTLLTYLQNKQREDIRETIEKQDNSIQIKEGMQKLNRIQELPKSERISIFIGALFANQLTDYDLLSELKQALFLSEDDLGEMIRQIKMLMTKANFEKTKGLYEEEGEKLTLETYNEMLNLIKQSPEIISDIKHYFLFLNKYFDENTEKSFKNGENELKENCAKFV